MTLLTRRVLRRLWLGALSRLLKALFKCWRGRKRLLESSDLLQDLIQDLIPDLTRDIMVHQLDRHAAVVDSLCVGVDVEEREEDMQLRTTQPRVIPHPQQWRQLPQPSRQLLHLYLPLSLLVVMQLPE